MPSLSRNASPHLDADFPFALFGLHAHAHRERCERALQSPSANEPLTRLKLTAHLVAALVDTDPAAAIDTARSVRKHAQHLGTPVARAYALTARGLTDHSPDTVGERLGEARIILDSAYSGGPPELAKVGHFLLLTALLEQGRMRILDLDTITRDRNYRVTAKILTELAADIGFPELLARAETTMSRVPTRRKRTAPTSEIDDTSQRVHIRILGVFDVTAHDGMKARWSSRKARELLKILIARRGSAVPRETLMHELWPDIDPDKLANRFSVALSTIRRTLDPGREQPAQHYITTDGDTLRLNHDAIRLDIDEFNSYAQHDTLDSLRHATELYTGDAFVEDPYADWADHIRHQAQTTFCTAAKAVAAHDNAVGNHLSASALYRRVLDIEPFDETAHNGLITALTELGAQGQASAMRPKRDLLREELAG